MNYCPSRGKLLLRNRLVIFIFLCFVSLCVAAQDSFALRSKDLLQHENIGIKDFYADSLFKKTRRLTSKWMDGVRNYYSEKDRNVFILPLVSWNDYDKFHQGVLLFSNPVAEKKLNYTFFPSWSFFSSTFNFSGQASYCFGDVQKWGTVKPIFGFRHYSYNHVMKIKPKFMSLHPEVEFHFGYKDSIRSGIRINFKYHHVFQEHLKWNSLSNRYELKNREYNMFQMQTETHTLRFADENSQRFNIEMNRTMGKLSLTEEHVFKMKNPEKGLYFRLFAGAFIYSQLPSVIDYRFRLSGYSGRDNYLFDLPFLARSETEYNALSGQMYPFDGYFKTPTPLGQTWDWLVALNMKIDFPGRIPLQFYIDAGTYSDAKVTVPSSTGLPWNAGLVIKIKKDIAEIYIPLFMSNDIKDIYELNNIGFIQRITWMVRFDKLSLSEILKKK